MQLGSGIALAVVELPCAVGTAQKSKKKKKKKKKRKKYLLLCFPGNIPQHPSLSVALNNYVFGYTFNVCLPC